MVVWKLSCDETRTTWYQVPTSILSGIVASYFTSTTRWQTRPLSIALKVGNWYDPILEFSLKHKDHEASNQESD